MDDFAMPAPPLPASRDDEPSVEYWRDPNRTRFRLGVRSPVFKHTYVVCINQDSGVYRLSLSRTVSPVAAERRAASRISITTTLTASDDGPAGFTSPRTTAVKYDSGSS